MTDSAAMTSPVPEIDYAKAKRWGDKLRTGRGRTVATIISFGKLLVDAQEDTTHGEWLYALEVAEIHPRDAQRYQRIANSPVLKETTNLSHLPTAVSSLDFLAGQQTELVEELIEKGWVYPDVTTRELKQGVLTLTGGATGPKRWSYCPLDIQQKAANFGAKFVVHAEDQIKEEWKGSAFVDPPTADKGSIQRWIEKTKYEWRQGRITEAVMWLPLDPLAGWFKHLFMERVLVLIPEMKLGGARVCLVYLGDRPDDFDEKFGILGTVIVQYTRKSAPSEVEAPVGIIDV